MVFNNNIYGKIVLIFMPSTYLILKSNALSGCLAVIVSNPFWVVNTRLKLQGLKIGGDGVAFKGASYDGIIGSFCMLLLFTR